MDPFLICLEVEVQSKDRMSLEADKGQMKVGPGHVVGHVMTAREPIAGNLHHTKETRDVDSYHNNPGEETFSLNYG